MSEKLPRLTPKQRVSVNALVKNECCNYDEGNCLLLDDGETHCYPQLISYSLLCQYFRRAVLPLKPKLEESIYYPNKTVIKCTECGKSFVKHSNSHKYCDNCAEVILRRQKLLYMERQKDKKLEK